MPELVENIPPVQCLVRSEYLHNLEHGHGEYEECFWVTAKSIPSRALYIESYISEYGALYDKLPISAYCWKPVENPLSLSQLQMWDCLSYSIVCIEKSFMRDRECTVMIPNSSMSLAGQYLFTLDSYGSGTLAETPNEHKSYNFIKLENGQFGAYPNNRILWKDNSFTPEKQKTPTFKTSTHYFFCETGNESFAYDDKYFYGNTEDYK